MLPTALRCFVAALPWTAPCEEVAKLNIGLRDGQLLELRKARSSGSEPGGGDRRLLQRLLQSPHREEKAPKSLELASPSNNAQGGTRNLTSEHQPVPADTSTPEISDTSAPPEAREGPAPTFDCSNVVNGPSLSEVDGVADQLEAVRTVWLRTGDEKALRRALLDLLRQIEGI